VWQHTVRKSNQSPILKVPGRRNTWNAARVIFDTARNPPIGRGWVLSRNRERCNHPLCVNPAHHMVRRRGASSETLAKARKVSLARANSSSVEARLAKRIKKRLVRDDTGCWRWRGTFDHGQPTLRYDVRYARTDGRRGKFLSSKYLSVRRFLWNEKKGALSRNDQLQHVYQGCSHPDECVNPSHMVSRTLEEHARVVMGPYAPYRRQPRTRQQINDQEWPGTLWNLDPTTAVCRECRHDFGDHGAPEWIGRKLNVPLNLLPYICPPHKLSRRR